jgi:hypothetical protein
VRRQGVRGWETKAEGSARLAGFSRLRAYAKRTTAEGRTAGFNDCSPNGRNQRILLIAGRPGEKSLHNPIRQPRHGVLQTATCALGEPKASLMEARVTKVAKQASRSVTRFPGSGGTFRTTTSPAYPAKCGTSRR